MRNFIPARTTKDERSGGDDVLHNTITNKPDITKKELAAVIGITEDGVKYHITRLRKKEL